MFAVIMIKVLNNVEKLLNVCYCYCIVVLLCSLHRMCHIICQES